jgi:hypothetical protein
VGNLPFVENADIHYAQSGIYTPGRRLLQPATAWPPSARRTSRPWSSTTLDLDLLRRDRERGTVQNWNDRRTDYYSLRYADGDGQRTVGVAEG